MMKVMRLHIQFLALLLLLFSAGGPGVKGVDTVVMMAIGRTGAGKSSLLNTLLCPTRLAFDEEDCHFETDDRTTSVTTKISYMTGPWLNNTGEFKGNVTLYDSPGFLDTRGNDPSILENIANTVEQHEKGYFSTFIYIHKATDRADSQMQTEMQTLQYIFGDIFYDHVVINFSYYSFNAAAINDRKKKCRKREKKAKNADFKQHCESLDYEKQNEEEIQIAFKKTTGLNTKIPVFFTDSHYDPNNEYEKETFLRYSNKLMAEASSMEKLICDYDCIERLYVALSAKRPVILGENATVKEVGDNMMVNCMFYTGLPSQEKLHWTSSLDGSFFKTFNEQDHDRAVISQEMISGVTLQGTLTISNLQASDIGTYRCEYGTGTRGKKSDTISLHVYDLTIADKTHSDFKAMDDLARKEWYKTLSEEDLVEMTRLFSLGGADINFAYKESRMTEPQQFESLLKHEDLYYKVSSTCNEDKNCQNQIRNITTSIDRLSIKIPTFVKTSDTSNKVKLVQSFTQFQSDRRQVLKLHKESEKLTGEQQQFLGIKIKKRLSERLSERGFSQEQRNFIKTYRNNLPSSVNPENQLAFNIRQISKNNEASQDLFLRTIFKTSLREEKKALNTVNEITKQEINKIRRKNFETSLKSSNMRKISKELAEEIFEKSDNEKHSYQRLQTKLKRGFADRDKNFFKQYQVDVTQFLRADDKLDIVKRKLSLVATVGNVNKLANSIDGIKSATFKFNTGRDIDVVSGALDIISTVSSLGGPYGQGISAVCGLVNSVLGIFNEGPTLTEVIGDMIQKQTEVIGNMITQQTDIIVGAIQNNLEKIEEVNENILKTSAHLAHQIQDSMRFLSTELEYNKKALEESLINQMRNGLNQLSESIERKNIINAWQAKKRQQKTFVIELQEKLKLVKNFQNFSSTDLSILQREIKLLDGYREIADTETYLLYFCLNGKLHSLCHHLLFDYVALATLEILVKTEIFSIYKESTQTEGERLADLISQVIQSRKLRSNSTLSQIFENQAYCLPICTLNEIDNTIQTSLDAADYNEYVLEPQQVDYIYKFYKAVGGDKEIPTKSSCLTCFQKQPCKLDYTRWTKNGKQQCIEGLWGNWSGFSQCSTTCNNGIQFRKRECLQGTCHSNGIKQKEESDRRICSLANCGMLSAWSSWTKCDQHLKSTRGRSCSGGVCNTGTNTQIRHCSKIWGRIYYIPPEMWK